MCKMGRGGHPYKKMQSDWKNEKESLLLNHLWRSYMGDIISMKYFKSDMAKQKTFKNWSWLGRDGEGFTVNLSLIRLIRQLVKHYKAKILTNEKYNPLSRNDAKMFAWCPPLPSLLSVSSSMRDAHLWVLFVFYAWCPPLGSLLSVYSCMRGAHICLLFCLFLLVCVVPNFAFSSVFFFLYAWCPPLPSLLSVSSSVHGAQLWRYAYHFPQLVKTWQIWSNWG